MKKIITILLALVLAVSMTVGAHAATPKFELNMPQVSGMEIEVEVEVTENFWDQWLRVHPLNIVRMWK